MKPPQASRNRRVKFTVALVDLPWAFALAGFT
jgi:hypothetical protein